MPSDYENEKSESRVVANRRYWSRTDSPKRWYPWGLLQLIGIAILFLIGALLLTPRIEADVRAQVSDRLRDAGVVTAVVSSSGQDVSIRASADETNEMVVRTIASSTRCRTWAGQLPCPTTVNVEFYAPTAKIAKLELRPHQFKVVRTDDAVTLSGEAPNLSENVGSSHDTARCNEDFEMILAATSVRFKTGSAMIDQSSESLLKRLAETAATCPGELVVEGHTDSRGGPEMNRALSQERAGSVRGALVRLGVEPGRLSAVGYGEQRPVADNDTADGRATNRRIVISTQSNN